MSGLLQVPASKPVRRCLFALGLVAALSACGQKGNLFLPTGEAAQGRASLPETLDPTSRTGSGTAVVPTTAASSVPPTGVVNPMHNQ